MAALLAAFIVATIAAHAGEAKPVDNPKRFKSPGATTYYVDPEAGDDARDGTAPERAWKSLERASATAYAPGDKLLLASSKKHSGTLKLTKADAGTADAPIVVTSSGEAPAIIDGGKGTAIRLESSAHVQLLRLTLVGCGRKDGNDGNGLELIFTQHAKVDEVDISGFRLSGLFACGDADSKITRARLHENGHAGLSVCGGYGNPRTKNLYIGHCVAFNNPGDPKNLTNHSGNGIVVGMLDDGLVEYCEAYDNGWDMPRKGNGPVGIWAFEATRLVIQHCVSHDNKTAKGAMDGGGFDFDGGVRDSVMQYNLSYHNHGAGYLLCQYKDASEWKDNVCRYNVSIDDALTNHGSGIHFWDGQKDISNAQIYNNLIVNKKHAVSATGDIAGLVFRNNIFITESDAIWGPLTKARFEGNFYALPKGANVCINGKNVYKTLEDWAKATGQETIAGKLVGLAGDPKVELPAQPADLPTDPDKVNAMRFGRLLPNSPCKEKGLAIEGFKGPDFFGQPLKSGRAPSMGVQEPEAAKP